MVEVVEDPGALNYGTTYAYDVTDNLLQVTQGVQNRYYSYSTLGRLLQASNPEAARVPIEGFALSRRSAALFNRDAAGEALAHLRPDPETAERIRAAAERAPADEAAATWLEKAPYGPRGVPRAETVYRY